MSDKKRFIKSNDEPPIKKRKIELHLNLVHEKILTYVGDWVKYYIPIMKADIFLSKSTMIYLIKYCLSPPTDSFPANLVDENIFYYILENKPLDFYNLPLADLPYLETFNAIRHILKNVMEERIGSVEWYNKIFIRIPDKFKTPCLCEEAYDLHNILCFFMPEERTNYDMFLKLSKGNYGKSKCSIVGDGIWNRLEKVPMKYRTLELCRNYITNVSGMNIRYVPSEIQSQELCNLAFEQNVNSVQGYIPLQYITKDMCMRVARLVGVIGIEMVPVHIPRKFQSKEFCETFHKAIQDSCFLRTLNFDCMCAMCKPYISDFI